MEYLISPQLSHCHSQVLSCGDNVLFCGLVHEEDVTHFPPELTDPDILSRIANFTPGPSARVTPLQETEDQLSLAPPVREFRLTSVKLRPGTEARVERLEVASTLFILRGRGSVRVRPGGSLLEVRPGGDLHDLHEVRQGQAYFVSAGQELEVKAESEGLEIYRTTLGQT